MDNKQIPVQSLGGVGTGSNQGTDYMAIIAHFDSIHQAPLMTLREERQVKRAYNNYCFWNRLMRNNKTLGKGI